MTGREQHSGLTQPREVACQWLLCCKRRLEHFQFLRGLPRGKLSMKMKIYLVGCKAKVRQGLGIKRREGIIKTQAEDSPASGTSSQHISPTKVPPADTR